MKDIKYEIITENEVLKKYELPDSILEIIPESEVVVFSVVDDILAHAIHSHSIDKIHKIEEVKKLKPLKAKKEYNLKLDTITKDPNLLRKIMNTNYPILGDCMRRVPE